MKRSMPPRKRLRTNKERERETVSEHKSGDHVVNKGVKTICYDIINKYLEDNDISTFHDGMTQTDTPTLYKIFLEDRNWPLSEGTVQLIDEMKVSSGRKDKPDDNSILFGEGKRCLVEAVVSTLNQVIDIIKNGDYVVLTRDKKKQFNQLRESLRDYVKKYYTHEGGVSRGEDGFYVDPEAKERWMKQPGNSEAQFGECRDAVRQIFHKLVGAKDNDPEEWLIYILAKEILHFCENLSATRSVNAKMRKRK